MIWFTTGILLAIYAYICSKSVQNGLLVLLGSLPLYLIKIDIFPIPTTLLELMIGIVFLFWLSETKLSGFVIASGSEATSLSDAQESSLSRLLRRFTPRNDSGSNACHKDNSSGLSKVRNLDLVLLATALIVTGAFLGLTQTSDMMSSLNAIKSFLIEPIIVAVMILSVVSKEKKLKLDEWMLALAVPVSILSLYAIFQWLTGHGIPDAWFLERRVTSFFPYPNALGHFIAPIVTMTIVWFMQRGFNRLGMRDLVLLGSTVLGIIALILSQTEAAWIAIVATMVIAGIVLNKHRNAWIAIGVLGVILAVAIPQTRHKLMLNDWSGQTRTAQWEETANFLKDSQQNFFLGAGANNYPNAMTGFHTHDYLEIFQQPHNIFLNIWVEYGLLGLTGFLLLSLVIVRSIQGCDPKTRSLATITLAAALLEMSIHGLVDVPYFKNDLSVLVWVLVALLLVSSYDTE